MNEYVPKPTGCSNPDCIGDYAHSGPCSPTPLRPVPGFPSPVPAGTPVDRAVDQLVRATRDQPYTWGEAGPAGFDVSKFTEPTDWNRAVREDPMWVVRTLLASQLRYRISCVTRPLAQWLERELVELLGRLP